jgi:hypothetical protein
MRSSRPATPSTSRPIALRDESARRRRAEARAERGGVTARDQHHGRRVERLGETRCHDESINVRELDVEQDNLRPELRDCPEHAFPIGTLADNVVPFGLEQRARRRPEHLVVVDDQHGRTHRSILAHARGRHIVASHRIDAGRLPSAC